MRDKRDVEIWSGDTVLVDEPGPDSDWGHSFEGVVEDIDLEGWWVIVSDSDGEIYSVDPLDLEVVDTGEG